MKPILMVDCYQDGAQAAPNFLRYLPDNTEVLRTIADPFPTDLDQYSGMVISGSSASVNDPPDWIPPLAQLVSNAAATKTPVFGVCFGHQLIAHVLLGDGTVRLAQRPEVGFLTIEVTAQDPLMAHLPNQFRTFVSHADEVIAHHSDMEILARSNGCENHAFRVKDLPIWGVQFHSEMDKAEHKEILTGRAVKHPELHLVLEDEMAKYVDAAPIATQLFDNFIHQVENLGVK